jgi:aerobic carbon-monoxide dehydrogenase small subunit
MTAAPVALSLRVNDEPHTIAASPCATLLDVMRDDLGLTGAKRGCNVGICGACNVLVDGLLVRSCLSLAAAVAGRSITTVEGFATQEGPSLVQQAFIDAGAIQCGFCMTGMIMSATALLAENPCPGREDIRVAISGNLCRCSGYVKVIEAIELAAARLATAKQEPHR